MTTVDTGITERQVTGTWLSLDHGGALDATGEALAAARGFAWERWREIQAERKRPEPVDMAGACKFNALFVKLVFGGAVRGNWDHVHNVVGGRIVDLSAGASDVAALDDPYEHDEEFIHDGDFTYSVGTCLRRCRGWAERFLADYRPNLGIGAGTATAPGGDDMTKASYEVTVDVTDEEALRSFARKLNPDLGDGIGIGAALEEVLVNPRSAPVESGYELVRNAATHVDGTSWVVRVEAVVHDAATLVTAARESYAAAWDGDYAPENLGDCLYEHVLASNASPAPLDIGFEIARHAFDGPELPAGPRP